MCMSKPKVSKPVAPTTTQEDAAAAQADDDSRARVAALAGRAGLLTNGNPLGVPNQTLGNAF